MKHDEVIKEIKQLVEKIELEEVVNCFLYSLSTRRLNLRSYLSSYVLAFNLPSHAYRTITKSQGYSYPKYLCGICGLIDEKEIDFDTLKYEKNRWGGVRLLDTGYVLLDLREFVKKPPNKPSPKDYQILKSILEIAREASEKVRISHLEKKIGKLFASNSYEKRVLLEILAIIGVIYVDEIKHFANEYIWKSNRFWSLTDVANDWGYPIFWWGKKQIKVDDGAVKLYFGKP